MDDRAALALVERALAPGEALLWWESAPEGPLRTMAGVGAVFLAVLTVVFVAMTWKALRRGGLAIRAALGLTLALLVAGEFVAVQSIFAAGSTAYALTDARLMIVSGEPEFSSISVQLGDIWDLGRDGDQVSFRYGDSPHSNAVTLWGLDDALAVEALIRERAPDA